MKITLDISDAEIQQLRAEYDESNARLPFAEWAGRAIAGRFSKAESQKGFWAVDATLDQSLRKRSSRGWPELLRRLIKSNAR